MENNIVWYENKVMCNCVEPKKITGTRVGGILGISPYKTPFATWCEMTHVYTPKHEESIYTVAGKILEPKIISFLSNYIDGIQTPTDVFGENYKEVTNRDFYPDTPIFGGMWDCKTKDAIIEIKTTRNHFMWDDDKIPEYYSLQASLYAYLEGVEKVIFAVTFLNDDDYDNLSELEISSENTIIKSFNLHDKYPNFETDVIEWLTDWYNNHIIIPQSPEYDPDKDKDILKELNTITLNSASDIDPILQKATELANTIAKMQNEIAELKRLKNQIKEYIQNIQPDANRVVIKDWLYTQQEKTVVDTAKLKEDNLFEKYTKTIQVNTLKRRD